MRSRKSFRTQTPTTSAATAVPTPRSTATLLIVTLVVLVNSLNHDSTATSTVVLGAAIPEAFHHLPCFSIIASVNNNFSPSLCSQVGPVTSFLIVFPENVFHVIVSLRDGGTMSTMFFGFGQFSPVLQSHGILAIDPLPCHLTAPRSSTVDPFHECE